MSHLGRAQGLVNLLRGSVPLARRRRVVVLPLALLNKHNLNQEMVLRLLLADPIQSQSNSSLENLLDMYHDLASEAHRHACTSAQLARQAIVEAKANDRTHSRHYLVRQMLPIVPVANYLHRLRTWAHFDPRRIDSYIDGLLPVKLSWYAWCNKLPPEPKA
ncbi:unnamed protein product [Echinostoma caproni]|uniref:Uncharacterized protein n=1 Tax=Echinostoma caproni TaxID=27848 RepID=A0A3P8K493_9TREM|nr:unnamed protein product [Echinostoma caproni]